MSRQDAIGQDAIGQDIRKGDLIVIGSSVRQQIEHPVYKVHSFTPKGVRFFGNAPYKRGWLTHKGYPTSNVSFDACVVVTDQTKDTIGRALHHVDFNDLVKD